MLLIYLYGALAGAFIAIFMIFHEIKTRRVKLSDLFLFFCFTFGSWFGVLVFLGGYLYFYLEENIDLNKKIF